MIRCISEAFPLDGFFEEQRYIQMGIDLSNESIANLRKDLNDMRD